MPGEQWELDESLVDENASTELHVGPVDGTASAHFQLGDVYVAAEEDLEHLHAAAAAEATSAQASAQAHLEAPLTDLTAGAQAQAPSAHAQGEIGPDGLALGAGASVYSVGAEAGAELAGETYSVGVEAQAGLGLGVDVAGPNLAVTLGPVSVQAPNPGHLIIPVIIEGIGDVFDGNDPPDDHAVTTDQHGGPSNLGPPGSHIID